MNKEFIPYEQALELKKLGFNEPCFGEWQNLKIGKNLVIDEEDRIYDISLLGADIKAPTFSQAFRWFREKYSILLYKDYGKVPHFTIIQNLIFENPDITYEEAELACIVKLIEIVKNK